MATRTVDVAIIGTGTSGMTAYRAVTRHTQSVLLVESGVYGTTCARVGCMPSKLLIAAGDAAHHVATAPRFGVHTGPASIDAPAVLARVRRERDRFVGFVVDTVEGWPPADRLRGPARFVDPHTLAVEGHGEVRAERIVIATGSRPAVPAGWREALGERLLTSDEVFEIDTLPASVAVVGSGAIALELGQALHRLGVSVRLFDRGGRFGALTDPVVTRAARELLGAELPIAHDAVVTGVARDHDSVRIDYTQAGAARSERFAAVLVAIGRTSNVDDLALESAGLALDARGVLASDRDTCRVGDTHVFVAGDACGRRMLLHEAADDGRIAGDNAGRWPDVRRRPRRAGLAIAFTDPQIAIAGRSHAELCAAGEAFECAEFDFEDQGRSRVMGRDRGHLRVYGSPHSDLFLGAEMIAPDGEHLGHLLAWAVQAGMTVQAMLDAPFYHPVVEEGVRTALRTLQRNLGMGPPPVPRSMDCGPGS